MNRRIEESHVVSNPKRKIGLYLNGQLWDEFKVFVYQKYGTLYGSPSFEVESMMKNWLVAHTNITQKPMKLNPIGSRTERTAREIIHALQEKIDTSQTHRNMILRVIEETRGNDERTVQKWFEYLRKHGHVKPLGGEIWEVI